MKRDREDLTPMASQGGELRPRGQIPDLDRLVAGSRGDHPAVGRDGDGADVVGMPAQNRSKPSAGRLVDRDPAGFALDTNAHDDQFRVRRRSQRPRGPSRLLRIPG